MSKAKILIYDIETSPNISYTWAMYEQNVIQFKKEWELLSFSYKWLDEKKVECVTRLDFRDKSDKSITKALWKVLNEANVVVAHNGKAFDNKKAQAKFVEHGLSPVSPFTTVDTREIARAHFKFNSNKLDDLGKLLGVGRKIRIEEGFDLWLKCMDGNKKAFAKMAEYNKQDVVLLEKVYKKLLPWMKTHPNLANLEGRPEACPKCGGLELQSRGTHCNTTTRYQRFQCKSCGGWCRSTTSVPMQKPKAVGI